MFSLIAFFRQKVDWGYRSYSMAGCNSSDVCNGKNETMPQGAHFKRCIGECCPTSVCNLGFYPVFPVVSLEPASSYASAMATGSVNLTSGTNNKKPGPTSRAATIVVRYHWLIFAVSVSCLPFLRKQKSRFNVTKPTLTICTCRHKRFGRLLIKNSGAKLSD